MVTINVMKKGDEVLSINERFLSIRRKDGTVDVFNVFYDDDGLNVDPVKVATIGYGIGGVEKSTDDGETKVITF